MIVRNISKGTFLTKDLKVASSVLDRLLGILNPKNPRSLLLQTRFGIHTFFLKEEIDVIILDASFIVVKAKTLKPNKVFLYNVIHKNVIELPKGSIKQSKTAIGDTLVLK